MISQRAKNTSPSPTLAITAKARAMKAQGIDVLSFGAGEPDFDTPSYVKEAAISAIQSGFTKYTPTAGIDDLRQAICDKLLEDNGLSYRTNEVLVSVGAKHSLYNAILTLCDPGDEVIIPSPYWVTYPEQVKLADGKPVIIETTDATGFKITPQMLESAVTAQSKLLVFNSPSNPTGATYTPEEVEAIAGVCESKGLWVISDEIYEKLVYDGNRHVSIASFGSMRGQTVVINGLSKSHAMTGWRIGYAAAPAEVIAAMGRIQDQSTSNINSITQKAGVAALKGPQETIDEMVVEFDRRRRYITHRLNDMKGVRCLSPGGAFYVFPNVSALYGAEAAGKAVAGSDDLTEYLLAESKVAAVPGSGFGADAYIRLSYATSMESIEKGMDRIGQALAKL
ncbi:MAG: pyridoxal phosphate-dependent aminotransferase [Armatimonadetes bacterium]|nr:pyridoxal phosphate-dependent aminotransferase [Armatimonadota bacterium]